MRYISLLLFITISCSPSDNELAPVVDTPSEISISLSPNPPNLKPKQELTITGTVYDKEGISSILRSIISDTQTTIDQKSISSSGVFNYQINDFYKISEDTKPGNYKVKVTAIDTKNNEVSTEQAFKIEELTQINISSPSEGQTISTPQNLTIEFDLTSNAGITSVSTGILLQSIGSAYSEVINFSSPVKTYNVTKSILVTKSNPTASTANFSVTVTTAIGTTITKTITIIVN
ncbi:MAG: hypothetical protein ACOYXA_14515 [Bacteroidota bacterium]